uniref:Aminotransferase-like plant mobile domain-containing protein n=1 Tax=Oryza sativa subsp. japonica TaxID=39947 RepID=Q9FRG9_ORYSJ|nr:hypothetical protein [Oryza sativa Japonica Group]
MAEERQPPTYPALEAYYEARHRGAAIEAGRVLQPLRVSAHAPPVFDDRYIPYLRVAGLLGVALVVSRGMPVFNAPALIALVDRWRPETHSFHLPSVEYHLPHRVMRQFGKKQDWPVEDISTGVELHKIEEREEVGDSSSSRIPQGRGKGKAPAPPSDDDDDDDEEDEDYVAPDAEEIDMSQLPDAPQGTQPTQYNLRSTRAAKKREAEGGANHPGAAVGEGGASQCREAEGFRAGGRAAPATLAPWSMRAAPAEARRQKGFDGGRRGAPAVARRQKRKF